MSRISLDWIQVVILLGALQGGFLVAALVVRRRNRTASRVLAGLVLTFTISLLWDVYYSAGLVSRYPHAFGISYPLPWLYGPLVYLYTLAASDRSWRLRAGGWLHFVPAVAVIVICLPIYSMGAADKVAMFQRIQAGDIPTRIAILDPFKFLSGLSYSVVTVMYLRRHRRRIEDSYSSPERVNLRWLLWLGGTAAGIWVLAFVVGTVDVLPSSVWRQGDALVALAIAIMVYAIGYMGLRQPEVFRYETAEFPVAVRTPSEATPVTADALGTPGAPDSPRYERSGLGADEADRLERQLLALMERERPWTNSELTLAELAAQLNTSPHKLSEVLNARIGETFYDFVNGYRVRDVQRRIAAGEARTRKMLALAMDAGFASKSTFNQVFKRLTSQTPSDFQQAAGA